MLPLISPTMQVASASGALSSPGFTSNEDVLVLFVCVWFYDIICYYLLLFVIICYYLLLFATICHYLLLFIIICMSRVIHMPAVRISTCLRFESDTANR